MISLLSQDHVHDTLHTFPHSHLLLPEAVSKMFPVSDDLHSLRNTGQAFCSIFPHLDFVWCFVVPRPSFGIGGEKAQGGVKGHFHHIIWWNHSIDMPYDGWWTFSEVILALFLLHNVFFSHPPSQLSTDFLGKELTPTAPLWVAECPQ